MVQLGLFMIPGTPEHCASSALDQVQGCPKLARGCTQTWGKKKQALQRQAHRSLLDLVHLKLLLFVSVIRVTF